MKNALHPNTVLRLIAIIRALRGAGSLSFGLSLLWFYQQHNQNQLMLMSKLNLFIQGLVPYWLVQTVLSFIEQHLALVILFLFSLATIRFLEAYGLWCEKRWGEWLTLIMTMLYIPLELMVLKDGIRTMPLLVLILNLCISYYLFRLLSNTKPQ
jgi:uncharacterized membrane protein (DUF2068 family)